mmetsp:Transcript_10370/g.33087  ORF Transcript_10370/g.33087 Transcript_10370/m.33087 type:complete len:256 (-) Transcript_10370:599-1366(-)
MATALPNLSMRWSCAAFVILCPLLNSTCRRFFECSASAWMASSSSLLQQERSICSSPGHFSAMSLIDALVICSQERTSSTRRLGQFVAMARIAESLIRHAETSRVCRVWPHPAASRSIPKSVMRRQRCTFRLSRRLQKLARQTKLLSVRSKQQCTVKLRRVSPQPRAIASTPRSVMLRQHMTPSCSSFRQCWEIVIRTLSDTWAKPVEPISSERRLVHAARRLMSKLSSMLQQRRSRCSRLTHRAASSVRCTAAS